MSAKLAKRLRKEARLYAWNGPAVVGGSYDKATNKMNPVAHAVGSPRRLYRDLKKRAKEMKQ